MPSHPRPEQGQQSLQLTGLRFVANLGILDHEKLAPQPIQVDAELNLGAQPLRPRDDDIHPVDDLLPLLRGALDSAHQELINRSTQAPELAGLGTTCIAMLRSGNKLGMVHIGDSRAYLLRGGILTQVTTDHTYVQHLVDEGRITPEEAATHPHRNMILRALGDNDAEIVPDDTPEYMTKLPVRIEYVPKRVMAGMALVIREETQ